MGGGALYIIMIKARCPNCEGDAELDENATRVVCKSCGYAADYDDYIESMKGRTQDMSADYMPDRSGL